MNEDHDPLREEGPDKASAQRADCEVEPGHFDQEGDAGPSFRDEIADAFDPGVITNIFSPEDGLPVPAAEPREGSLFEAPPLTVEHLVCMEDASRYVELFVEDMMDLGWEPLDIDKNGEVSSMARAPHEVINDLGGPPVVLRARYNRDGTESVRRDFLPEELAPFSVFGVAVAVSDEERGGNGDAFLVRAKRPECVHYRRQVYANTAEPDPNVAGHRLMARNCMVRKSLGGAFMSLSDEAVYACEYREPRDQASELVHIRRPDEKRITKGARQVAALPWANKEEKTK